MMTEKFYKLFLLTSSVLLLISCGDEDNKEDFPPQENDVETYIKSLEKENGISYKEIKNLGAYIPSLCYTKTKDQNGKIHNSCYSCHTKGKIPNYINDSDLQLYYNFPKIMLKNPYTNLFTDKRQFVNNISDEEILSYIRKSNYFDTDGEIKLKKTLPKGWEGYIPDCYFNFDDEGFDIDPFKNEYTGWRAFRYYPFLGTFWPTNGSTDDVLIRLPKEFMQDENGNFNKEIYKINLAIVEALVKQKDIKTEALDERVVNLDLNKDGKLGIVTEIKYTWDVDPSSMTYVGKAGELLKEGKMHLAGGLFPEGTEFLHTVRYIDWDEEKDKPKLSNRLREVRYAIKKYWLSYADLHSIAEKELMETSDLGVNDFPKIETFGGNFETGMDNGLGWYYLGFIEDKEGNLRPQTNEETLFCMGCHGTIGATTDTIFSFPRKFEGSDKNSVLYGWGHWSQKDLSKVPEPIVEYLNFGKQYEYSFYLKNNNSGNEFRDNEEIIRKFFNNDGTIKEYMLQKLHADISILLYPSKERALTLDKAYRYIVENQSYIKGRAANVSSINATVNKEVEPKQSTGIDVPIIKY